MYYHEKFKLIEHCYVDCLRSESFSIKVKAPLLFDRMMMGEDFNHLHYMLQ
jgi:hypothetical protein